MKNISEYKYENPRDLLRFIMEVATTNVENLRYANEN